MIYSITPYSGANMLNLRPDQTAAVFAEDILRRAQSGRDETPSVDPSNDLTENLKKALAGTAAYMTREFGEKAATAMMGLIYKRIGDDAVTEENLGKAFLSAVRFVDTNFGLDKGDAFIQHLNGALNDSLNAYFDNGMNEKFMAVTTFLPQNKPVAVPEGGTSVAEAIMTLLRQYETQRKTDQKSYLPYDPADAASGILLDGSV